MSFHLCETDPRSPMISLLLWWTSKETVCTPAQKCQTTGAQFTLGESWVQIRESERVFRAMGPPLVEEKQRCKVTWIFLQVFNQDEKMALFDSSLLSTMFLLDQTEPQSLCMLNLRKSSNNFNMTYWLFSMRWPVLLLLLQPIQVTVLTASLSWVYSIYILVYLLQKKKKKQVHTISRETLVEIFCKTKIWLLCLLEADFNQEKADIKQSNTRFWTGWAHFQVNIIPFSRVWCLLLFSLLWLVTTGI